MKTIRYIFLSFLLVILSVGCEREIEFTGGEIAPLLVMNGVVKAGDKVQIRLTKSRFFLDNNISSFTTIKDAAVNLYVNGQIEETLVFKEATYGENYYNNGNDNDYIQGFYESNYKPKAGDLIKIIAVKGGFDDAVSEFTVPNHVPIIDVEIIDVEQIQSPIINYEYDFDAGNYDPEWWGTDTIGYFLYEKVKIKMKFNDHDAMKNFYRVEMIQRQWYEYNFSIDKPLMFVSKDYYDNQNSYFFDPVFSSNDPVFSQTNSSIDVIVGESINNDNPFVLFTDELFDGKEYSIEFTVLLEKHAVDLDGKALGNLNYEFLTNELVVQLHHISRDYYLYLRTLEAYNNQEPLFSEPVQIYSNVKGGIGMLGSISVDIKQSFIAIE